MKTRGTRKTGKIPPPLIILILLFYSCDQRYFLFREFGNFVGHTSSVVVWGEVLVFKAT